MWLIIRQILRCKLRFRIIARWSPQLIDEMVVSTNQPQFRGELSEIILILHSSISSCLSTSVFASNSLSTWKFQAVTIAQVTISHHCNLLWCMIDLRVSYSKAPRIRLPTNSSLFELASFSKANLKQTQSEPKAIEPSSVSSPTRSLWPLTHHSGHVQFYFLIILSDSNLDTFLETS